MTAFSFASHFASRAADPKPLGMNKRGKYDFAVAYPDPDTMPLDGLVEGLKQALVDDGRDLALYAHPQGYTPLREFVAARLQRDRNIQITADDIILGDGSGQPIHMIAETLLDPGDVVIVEDFVYAGTLNTLRRFGAELRGVATDDEGMQMDSLETVIQGAVADGKPPKFIYTVPTFQNPQGWTMSLERRQAMVALCQKYGVPILEDDCYVDLRFEGQDVTSLYSLDDAGLVMYVASFSKIIGPGMRLGYLTAPKEILQRALGAKSGGSVNTFASFAIHRFSQENLLSHIETINDVQLEKRDAMLAALDEHFNEEGVSWSRPQGGIFIWLKLRDSADAATIRDKVLETDGVGYLPGSNFAADGVSGQNCLRLCFGYNTPEEIGEGIGVLAAAFRREGVL